MQQTMRRRLDRNARCGVGIGQPPLAPGKESEDEQKLQ